MMTCIELLLLYPASAIGVIILTLFFCYVCVYVSRSHSRTETFRLEFWHVGQVEGYLGQV